jgi:hypothetical protein
MPQIKNVSRPPASLVQNALYALAQIGTVGIEDYRVQIALDPHIPETLPGVIEFDPEIHANDVTASLAHELQQGTGASAKVNHRHPRREMGNDRS